MSPTGQEGRIFGSIVEIIKKILEFFALLNQGIHKNV